MTNKELMEAINMAVDRGYKAGYENGFDDGLMAARKQFDELIDEHFRKKEEKEFNNWKVEG